jgi:hypothetical protein
MKQPMAKIRLNKNWQAAASCPDGQRVEIMRGQSVGRADETGGPSEGMFYLYGTNWTPIHELSGGMRSYSAGEIKNMFSSGELSLLEGSIPR